MAASARRRWLAPTASASPSSLPLQPEPLDVLANIITVEQCGSAALGGRQIPPAKEPIELRSGEVQHVQRLVDRDELGLGRRLVVRERALDGRLDGRHDLSPNEIGKRLPKLGP